jgi:hypothetical protein
MRRNAKPQNAQEEHERERALAALALMRRGRRSASAAARDKGTTLTSMRLFVGSALRKDRSGHYRATRYDRIPRTLNFPSLQGPIQITVRDSRTASRIGEYSNARRTYRDSRDLSVLAQYKSRSFRADGVTYRFITDPAAIDELEDAGVADIESLYYAQMAS